MTLDGYPYYNPAAVPFCLEQPLGMPEEENFRQRKLAEKNPLLRLHPDSKASDTFAILFESALDRAFRELDGWKRDGGFTDTAGASGRTLFQGRHPRRGSSPPNIDALLPGNG